MPISVACPNPACARVSRASDDTVGRRVKCPGCGQPFVAAATVDAARARAGGTHVAATFAPAQAVGRFVVRSKLGAGAFGTVYRAYDPQLDREVALKVPNAGVLSDDKRVERFLREAKAAANLRHPHIVPVYDAGKDADRYFIASAFIEGRALSDAIEEGGTDFPRAARLARELADALAYAHGQGVVHRDVKPHNCMVDGGDRLHLMDFGLAARTQDSGEAKLTNDGAVMGTPAYMAPEQAAGKSGEAGPRADQYACGVVLYELLTGRTPFTGPPAIVIFNVLNTRPDPPRRHRPDAPRDLETICLKAMAKAPKDRYPDLRAMADDLRRWLDGEPIAARRLSATEQFVRWVRRNKLVAGLAAAVAASLLAGAAVALAYASQQSRLAEQRNDLLRAEQTIATEQQARADATASAAEGLKRESAKTAQNLYRSLLDQAAATHLAREPGYRPRVWELLRQAGALDVPQKDPDAVRETVLACLGDPVGLEVATDLAPLPRPTPVPAHFRDLVSAAPPARPPTRAISADGQLLALASAGGRVTVRDASKVRGEMQAALGPIHALAFTPDGALLIAGCEEGFVVWDADTLAVRTFSRGPSIGSISVHPRGHLLATSSQPHRCEIWSLESNRLLRSFTSDAVHGRFAFTGDGRHLAALGPDGRPVRGWPVLGTPEKLLLPGHAGGTTGAAFTPDGRYLVSCSKDRTVRVWDARTGDQVRRLTGHRAEIQALALSADGELIAAGDWSGLVLVWRRSDGVLVGRDDAVKTVGGVWSLRFGPGSVLVGGGNGGAGVWEVHPDREPGLTAKAFVRTTPGLFDAVLHPSGKYLAVSTREPRVLILPTDGSGPPRPLNVKVTPSMRALAFVGDGRLLRYNAGDGAISTHDWEKDVPGGPPTPRSGSAMFAVTRDESRVAFQNPSNRVVVFDYPSGAERVRLPAEWNRIWSLDWSPDGDRLAVGAADGGLAIWNVGEVAARLNKFGGGPRPPGGSP